MFLAENFGVGRHIGFYLMIRVVDRDAYLEGGDVVFLNAEGCDPRHLAGKRFVLERFDADPRRLPEVHRGDIRLVHLAVYIDLAGVPNGHDQRGGGPEDQNGADRVAHLNIAGEHLAIDG